MENATNFNSYPKDFMFRITKEESELLVRCQKGIAMMQEPGTKEKNNENLEVEKNDIKLRQNSKLPYAFPKGISINNYAKRRN